MIGRAAVLAMIVAACAHAPATPTTPRGPSAIVRADVDRAEKAELARHHDVARAAYQQAVADAHDVPSEVFARREFAETLMQWRELPEAIAQLEALVAIKPDHAGSWIDLGVLFDAQGDLTRAADALERAKRLVPADYNPRLGLAAVRWKQHDYAAAVAEYKALLELTLPERVRAKIPWALDQLAKLRAAPTPSS
jgi:tetratricopeptide (TPR) repeat protein